MMSNYEDDWRNFPSKEDFDKQLSELKSEDFFKMFAPLKELDEEETDDSR